MKVAHRISLIKILTIVACGTVAFCVLLEFPPYEARRALLSCVHCGNTRTVLVIQRWWQVKRVFVSDSHDYPIRAGHAHSWFQYNSKWETTWHYEGWTRDKYETGGWEWEGPPTPDRLTRPADKLRESWLP